MAVYFFAEKHISLLAFLLFLFFVFSFCIQDILGSSLLAVGVCTAANDNAWVWGLWKCREEKKKRFLLPTCSLYQCWTHSGSKQALSHDNRWCTSFPPGLWWHVNLFFFVLHSETALKQWHLTLTSWFFPPVTLHKWSLTSWTHSYTYFHKAITY